MAPALPPAEAGSSRVIVVVLAVAAAAWAIVILLPGSHGKPASARTTSDVTVARSESPNVGAAARPAAGPAEPTRIGAAPQAENAALDGPPAEADLDINNHAALTSYIESQPRDAHWSPRTEEALRSAFAAIPIAADPDSRFDIRCAMTLCRVSVTIARDDEAAATRLIDGVTAIDRGLSEPGQPFIAASTTAVADDPEDARRLRIIAFLQREARATTP